MEEMTLTFLVSPPDEINKVWLAKKKKKIGKGKFNGYGGRVENGEDILHSAVREIKEESTVIVHPRDLIKRSTIDFFRGNIWDFTLHIFVTTRWIGEPKETEEMEKPEKFYRNKLPLTQMMEADKLWAPDIVMGIEVPPPPKSFLFICYNQDRTRVISHNIPADH